MGSRNRFAAGASGFNWSPWQVEPQQLLPPHSDADADAAAAAAMVHSHPHPPSHSHSSSHSQPFGYGGEVENQGLYGGGGGVGHVHSSAGSSASTFGPSQYRNAGAAAAGSDLSIQIQMQMQMSHHHHHQNHHLSSSSSSTSYHYQDQEEQAQSHRNNNHHHQHNMNSAIPAGTLVRGLGYPFSVAKTEPCASSSSSIMDATDLNLAVSSFNLNIKRPRTVNMHGGGSVVGGGVPGAGTAAATGLQVPICQAEGCWVDLTCAKHYYKRHRVCEFHSKATTVSIGGRIQRFCQQCSRFHSLQDFDEGKRSCRKRLAEHNRRRRKSHVGNCDSALIASADVSSGDDHSSSVADSANSNSVTTTTSTALNLYPHSSAAAAAAMAMGVGVAMNMNMSSRTAMNHHNVNNVAAEDLAHHNNNHHQHLRRGEESFWGLRHASASDEIHFDALAGSSAINKYEDDEDEDRHSHRQRHRHRREEEEEDDDEEDNDDDENDNDDDCDGGGGGSIRFSHSFLPVGPF